MRNHPATSSTAIHGTSTATTPTSAAAAAARGKKRGSYNCGKCGLPKKGHVCSIPDSAIIPSTPTTPTVTTTSTNTHTHTHILCPTPLSRLPRALSFDHINLHDQQYDDDFDGETDPLAAPEFDPSPELDPDEPIPGGLPAGCLWEVLKRVPPPTLLSASRVCKDWREFTKRMWRSAEELTLHVPERVQVGTLGSVLKRCSGLVRLSLMMESDVDATTLACIAFSCPNLESMDIRTSDKSINRITGDELSRFVADKRCLQVLKMEGCSNLGALIVSSSSLTTLSLSDLHSLSKTVFNCPNMREISLDFTRRENDTTDLIAMVDNLGRSCPRLQNIRIASFRFSHAAVLALTAAHLRALRMLSLVLSTGITDASVAAITSSFTDLELLDLSGSSISDSGIGMICNMYPETLSNLLLALCPNVSSSGIQFATAQLPFLEIMDCGMTMCDLDSESASLNESCSPEPPRTPNKRVHLMHQKLIIKHSRLKKLSLWGCSGLDGLYLNCPELNDLNLNSCTNLRPEKLDLQCPNVENVHASGCYDKLKVAIQNQVNNSYILMDSSSPLKRMADGSKRVRVPYFVTEQSMHQMNDELKRLEARQKRRCLVID